MNVEQVLHMNGGEGKKSYASHSLYQVTLSLSLSLSLFQVLYTPIPVPEGLLREDRKDLNKGNICIAKTSPPAVHEAYFEQFQRDFTTFLKCRAKELVPGSSMILTTMGCIKTDDPLNIWELIGLKLYGMVLEGLIEEEKLDRFNLPFYATSAEEVKKLVEGSFGLHKLESFKTDWETHIKKANNSLDSKERAAIIAADIRTVAEPILVAHFGDKIMDKLFDRVGEDVLDHMLRYNCQNVNLVISLTKKG
ncbi:hypothetical protein FEM48_Zijuj05G0130300 [Ziziphus jujuba var. spinosa]|uniref:Salicylate carboxymethyltransferase-like n=1 Tax=Ziziphus jujuba var. spinosa TaxID=714518 RepID=A0A978VEZ4_ZIZJJ|nr:hypothetical protein FEM48_Zijuj05G0130300 [Ziziphus jujuba var. spinosa]